jgi:hypothetical protein
VGGCRVARRQGHTTTLCDVSVCMCEYVSVCVYE